MPGKDGHAMAAVTLDRSAAASILETFWRERQRLPFDELLSRYVAEDATWRFLGWPESVLPGPRVFEGWEEVRHAARIIDANVESLGFAVFDLIVEGSCAALLRVNRLVHRATGRTSELAVHDLVAFRGNRIVSYQQFLDTDAFAAIVGGEAQPVGSRLSNRIVLPAPPAPAAVPSASEALRERRRRQLRDLFDTRMREGGGIAFDRFCTADFELNLIGDMAKVPFARRHVGRAAVIELVGMIDREFSVLNLDIRSILIEGDRAAMHYVVDVKHRGTGSVGQNESFFRITFEDDRLSTMTEFFDTRQTAGLIEG
jgi:ketosteroid isomerase-like protein